MLELQRNVIFGQFVETGSPIHKMDPRVKLAIAFVLIVGSFLVRDFLGFAILVPLLALVHRASRIPIGFVLMMAAAILRLLGRRG